MAKRINKTKSQIVEDFKVDENVKRLREFVKTKFHPYMLDVSTDIEHAKILLQSLNVAVMTAFDSKKSTTTIDDLKLISMLSDNEEANKFKGLLELLATENIKDFTSIIDGYQQAIEAELKKENKTRPLSDVKVQFYD